MVGGTTFHRNVISREISRVLFLNLSGAHGGPEKSPGRRLPLTQPSLLSRATRPPDNVTVRRRAASPTSWMVVEVPRKRVRDPIGIEGRSVRLYDRMQQARQLLPTIQKRYQHKPIP